MLNLTSAALKVFLALDPCDMRKSEVLANPEDWQEIGEEHHDELDVIKSEIFWRRTTRKKLAHKTDKTRRPSSRPPPSR